MPIAIIASLVVCTVIYILVAVVLTGMLPWTQLGTAEPLATAFSGPRHGLADPDHRARRRVRHHLRAARLPARAAPHLLLHGARRPAPLLGGQGPPDATARPTSPPGSRASRWRSSPAIANINEVVELTNIGTLFAFLLVCIGVTVLRYKDPGRVGGFRVPGGAWLVPHAGRRLLHLPDGLPAAFLLVAVHRLAGARHGDLLLLRLQP